MWNNSVSIPRKTEGTQDDDGFAKEDNYYEGGIPANFMDVTRDDEILAAQRGYTVNQNVEIVSCNYAGEGYLVDESTGDILEVKRTYQKDKSMNIILSCERRERGKV